MRHLRSYRGLANILRRENEKLSSRDRNHYHFMFHGHGGIFGVARGCANMKIIIFCGSKPRAMFQRIAKFKGLFIASKNVILRKIISASKLGKEGCANFCGKNNVCLRGNLRHTYPYERKK